MIIISDKTTEEGTWCDFELRGETVRLKVRPLTSAIIERLRKKHRTIKKGVETFDSEAIADGLADHVLEAFEGFGGEDGKTLEVTSANRKAVMQILPMADEQAISEFIFEKAKQLALKHEEAVEKN